MSFISSHVSRFISSHVSQSMIHLHNMRMAERLSRRLQQGTDRDVGLHKYSRIDHNNKMGALIEQAILDTDDKRIIVLAAPQNSSKTTITCAVARNLLRKGRLRGFTHTSVLRPQLVHRDAIFKSIIDLYEPDSDTPIVDVLKDDSRPALFILDQIESNTKFEKATNVYQEQTRKFLVDLSNEMRQNTNPDRQFKIIAITNDFEATAKYIHTPEIKVIGGASCRMDTDESGRLVDAYASSSPEQMERLAGFGRDKLVDLATKSGMPCVVHMFFIYRKYMSSLAGEELEAFERRVKNDDGVWREWETLGL